ncbi:hypothetical protein ACRE_057810 [Hapsidospora chrysogenum ATCC 11550]|uniref:Defect at low temperature protein 1 n=1 Tax=Hapsidospora chrysogenum (strain ATCC 11550 / CBS 779.69 / DSM 880 / IAM 14645 / JCM 23072 / IMI 49137) TaxID=857340 RepID=A0A086T252_HAPC1|nr:hypothetical protein ACRE_057810 [Hapsidospora chrysogenum ATCC 11550]
MANSSRISRIVYKTIYIILYIILLTLLIITPADAIERSVHNRQNYNVWLLIIFYVVTVVVVSFIYLVRLYVNKTVLAAIPKAWVPIELGDVNKRVHRIIAAGLDRSAAIAYEARPRPATITTGGQQRAPKAAAAEGLGVSAALQSAIWGDIEHEGWASPNSPDLHSLQYSTVLSELPNLIEAKAMTLAPPHPTSQIDPPPLDPEAVALLQRPENLSLRGYVEHLTSLGVLMPDETTTNFLQQYEYARFSTRPISNARFRQIMHLFAQILRSMGPLDLEALEDDTEPSQSGDSAHRAIDYSPSSTPRSRHLSRTTTRSTQGSVRRPSVAPLARSSSWTNYRTAPNTPRSGHVVSRKSSSSSGGGGGGGIGHLDSFAQTRRMYQASSSSSSLSVRSGAGSPVIRLATREEENGEEEGMPYVLNLAGTAETFRG